MLFRSEPFYSGTAGHADNSRERRLGLVSKKDEFILDMLRMGCSQREIAVYFDVSASRISQIVSEMKKNLSVVEDINNVIEIDWITL